MKRLCTQISVAGLALFFAVAAMTGCQIGDNKKDSKKSYRLSVQHEYDSTGTTLLYTFTYNYDSNNVLTSVTNYDNQTLSSTTTTYSYDSNGRRSKSLESSGAYTTYTYDSNGYLIRTDSFSSTGSTTGHVIYTVDNSGIRSQGLSYNSSGSLSYTYIYTNNSAGQRTGKTVYDSSNNIYYTSVNEFDTNGNISKITLTYPNITTKNNTRIFTFVEGSTNFNYMDTASFSRM